MDTVLAFGGSAASFQKLGVTRSMGEGEIHLTLTDEAQRRRDLAVLIETDVSRTMRRLNARPIDVLVVDTRAVPEGAVVALLDRLFPRHEVAQAARRQRTLVVVSADAA